MGLANSTWCKTVSPFIAQGRTVVTVDGYVITGTGREKKKQLVNMHSAMSIQILVVIWNIKQFELINNIICRKIPTFVHTNFCITFGKKCCWCFMFVKFFIQSTKTCSHWVHGCIWFMVIFGLWLYLVHGCIWFMVVFVHSCIWSMVVFGLWLCLVHGCIWSMVAFGSWLYLVHS